MQCRAATSSRLPPSRCRCQVGALLARPACQAALLAMGFRPVLLPPRPGGPAGDDASRLGLVADHSADSGSDGAAAARRAAMAVLALAGPGDGGGKSGGGGAAGTSA
jgi:hypothetical protein